MNPLAARDQVYTAELDPKQRNKEQMSRDSTFSKTPWNHMAPIFEASQAQGPDILNALLDAYWHIRIDLAGGRT